MSTTEKKVIYSWALYDWANSAFATTVMAGFFPLFFKQYWSDGVNVTDSTFYLGLANSVASFIVLLIAPFIGAIADYGRNRRQFLAAFAIPGIVATGLLFTVSKGHWPYAFTLYLLAVVGFSGGNVFYDALLMAVAKVRQRHRVSALGFGMGYLGGGLLFVVNVAMILHPDVFGLETVEEAVRWSFITVALWWGIFSIPLFLWVREPESFRSDTRSGAVISGVRSLMSTVRNIGQHKEALQFLIAYWLYIDGVGTIIKMAVAFGSDIGLASTDLIKALLLTQFISFPAAIVFGRIGEKIGAKQGIFIAILVYSIVSIYACFLTTATGFYILAACIGLVQGGIQSLSRSLFSRLVPQDRSGEFFGLYNMVGKFSAVIGPVLVGTVSLLTGNTRFGIAAVLVLFITGAYLLRGVPEKIE